MSLEILEVPKNLLVVSVSLSLQTVSGADLLDQFVILILGLGQIEPGVGYLVVQVGSLVFRTTFVFILDLAHVLKFSFYIHIESGRFFEFGVVVIDGLFYLGSVLIVILCILVECYSRILNFVA